MKSLRVLRWHHGKRTLNGAGAKSDSNVVPQTYNSDSKCCLPQDVLSEIGSHLPLPAVLKLMLTCRDLYHLLLQKLYSCPDLGTNAACKKALQTLKTRPELARYVEELTVQPNHPPKWSNSQLEDTIDEVWVATTIGAIASAGNFSSLRKFRWKGMEPPMDSLWLTLRKNCHRLLNVGTTVGQHFQNTTHLFEFRGLVGFSLTLQHSATTRYPGMATLPEVFWDMILVECPNLRSLTVDGSYRGSSHLDGSYHGYPTWDIRRLLRGRWPKLKHFAIGSFSNKLEEGGELQSEIAEFLSAHSDLDHLELSSRMLNNHEIAAYSSAVLPHLCTFRGVARQMAQSSASSLQNLFLSTYLTSITRDFQALQSLPNLLALNVELHFLNAKNAFEPPESVYAYNLFLMSFPNLRSLQITTNRSIALSTLSTGLREARNLVSLFVAGFISDKQLTQGAILVAHKSSRLLDFTILDFTEWDVYGRAALKAIRAYVIERDHTCTPRRLVLTQKGDKVGKWLRFSETFAIDLS